MSKFNDATHAPTPMGAMIHTAPESCHTDSKTPSIEGQIYK